MEDPRCTQMCRQTKEREECAWCLEPWAQKGEGGTESPDLDLLGNLARHLYNGLL